MKHSLKKFPASIVRTLKPFIFPEHKEYSFMNTRNLPTFKIMPAGEEFFREEAIETLFIYLFKY